MSSKKIMTQKYLLSIDQGTTSTTVVLMDTGGRIRGKAAKEFRQFFPNPVGWSTIPRIFGNPL